MNTLTTALANHVDALKDLNTTFATPLVETVLYLTPVINVLYQMKIFAFHHQIFVRGYKRNLQTGVHHPYLRRLGQKVNNTIANGTIASLVNAIAGYLLKRYGFEATGKFISNCSGWLFVVDFTQATILRDTKLEIEKTEGKIF